MLPPKMCRYEWRRSIESGGAAVSSMLLLMQGPCAVSTWAHRGLLSEKIPVCLPTVMPVIGGGVERPGVSPASVRIASGRDM